jgi:hypothetical protein
MPYFLAQQLRLQGKMSLFSAALAATYNNMDQLAHTKLV